MRELNSLLFFTIVLFIIGCRETTSENVSLYPFPVEDVVLKDSWIKHREELTINYLRSLEADRLLHNFRINAGLVSDAIPLEGWESPQIGLRGHFVGHYLSAASYIIRKYNDDILREKLEYLVDELSRCQDMLGSGYLSAFPDSEFDTLETYNRGVWAPYYTYHKLMQGLLDVFVNTKNLKAYHMLLKMADYVDKRMARLDSETISRMLYTAQANPSNEAGGMNEVLYKLYKISNDERHLKLAQKFDRNWFLMPLVNNEDILSGLHANTHIALVNGFAACYMSTRNPIYYDAVVNFWDMLINKHAYVNGSSSGPRPNVTTPTSAVAEHWGRPGELSNTLTKKIAETCVTYNTQKITSTLFQLTGNPKYADAYMNTYYNAVLSAQNGVTGEVVYHLPLGSPREKVFLDNDCDFRCCNGTGIELFSSLNNNIYFHDKKNLWVNLYIPSILKWEKYKLVLSQKSDFISNQQAQFIVKLEQSRDFAINLFIPSWSENAQIFVNDKLEGIGKPNSFFSIDRTWSQNDRITIRFHFDFRIETMPDAKDVVAVFYGPMLLAFEGPEEIVLRGSPELLKDKLVIVNQDRMLFSLYDTGKTYSLKPLFDIKDEMYSVYVQANKLSDDKW